MPIAGENSRKPRIDFHVHLGIYTTQQPWVTEWFKQQTYPGGYEEYVKHYGDPGAFEDLLSEEGVDYACILAELSPITSGICSNDQVRIFCQGRSRLIPFCDVNPHQFNNLGEELRRKVELEGFRGLKLYPTYQHYYLNEPRMYPLYQVAEELGIPVLIHTGSSVFKGARLKFGDPLHLDDVAADFPRLNLVMAHSGRGFWYDKAFFLSRLHANVYMELSGLPPSKLLTYFPELARNMDKVIYGSDWPGMPWIRRNMDAISHLPLPAEGMEDVLGGNAAKLLKL
jgi:predicted TIM-barrel fold metal-dependent hydrolase